MTTAPQLKKLRGEYLPHRRRLPHRKPALVLQDRDIEIVRAVWENRFLTFSLLVQLFPPEPARTPLHVQTAYPKRPGTNLERRLAKLFHHGFLQRIRTWRGGEFIYALDQHGAHLLQEFKLPTPHPIDWTEKNRALSHLYLDHALMVARFRTALMVAVREHPAIALRSFARESLDLKAAWQRQGQRVYVNPDAFFILRDESLPEGKQHTAFFLEADRSTMPLKRLLEKYVHYGLLYADGVHRETFGIPSFRVLTITKSRERASNILKLSSAEDSPIPPNHKLFFYFTTEESYHDHPTNTLAAIWRRADEPQTIRAIISAPLPRRT